MKNLPGFVINLILLLFITPLLRAQPGTYILNGSATQDDCHCYTLTQAVNTQGGSVWNANKISLDNPFDFTFSVYLGCTDANGADGIVFMLQPLSTSIGTTGEGMGFQGIVPSVGIPLDTWQNGNLNDPAFDHISIQLNGNPNHAADPVPPMQASATNANIEDCQWHELRIRWDPVTKKLATWFDGAARVEATIDLVATVFNNDPNVFWGFSGATGGANNLQRFCTALNPRFNPDFSGNGVCAGTPISFQNTSTAFGAITSYYWNFGDGNTSNIQNPPAHIYNTPGVYEVKLVITGQDGCISDTLRRTITIGDKPSMQLTVRDTCFGQSPWYEGTASFNFGTANTFLWSVDGGSQQNVSAPDLTNLAPGMHTLQLTVGTDLGCMSDPVTDPFQIHPLPQVAVNTQDICTGEAVSFSWNQLDNQTSITNWQWTFDEGGNNNQVSPVVTFNRPGLHTVKLDVTASTGCAAKQVEASFLVNQVTVQAPADTIVLQDELFQLNGGATQLGNQPLQFTWSPATGLSNLSAPQTTGRVSDDITYQLTALSAEGCTGSDTVRVTVFKGSGIYVPTGFTPNRDGRNDLLRPRYYGIRKVEYFMVYNRWGQEVFRTTDMTRGWDGAIGGREQDAGVYVWIVKAVDVVGNVISKKGVTTLIR